MGGSNCICIDILLVIKKGYKDHNLTSFSISHSYLLSLSISLSLSLSISLFLSLYLSLTLSLSLNYSLTFYDPSQGIVRVQDRGSPVRAADRLSYVTINVLRNRFAPVFTDESCNRDLRQDLGVGTSVTRVQASDEDGAVSHEYTDRCLIF